MLRCCTGGASSSRSPPAARSLGLNTGSQAFQVNDSLYELHKPSVAPNVQVVLFHGLQQGDYLDAHLSTWQSEDGSCIWPQKWVVEEFPLSHVLSVSYSGGLSNTSRGNRDMYVITENLLSDLLQGDIGKDDYCPVILVGHSIGGLVIKQLCLQAHAMLHNKPGSETTKLETFLNNIKGIFYYATPHHGSLIAQKLAKRIPSPLLTYFRALSKDTERLNHEFDNLYRVRDKWMFAGLGEALPTNLGPFEDFIVPEASARVRDFNVVEGADHFSICRPKSKSLRSFSKLKDFIGHIVHDMKDAKTHDDICTREDVGALRTAHQQNFQYVPNHVVGIASQVQQIISKLDNLKTLGLVGMGGLGKTTLAMEVFNKLAPNFEYTCFVPNVKLIDEDEMHEEVLKHLHWHGKKVREEIGNIEWRRKPLLMVLDDIYGERDEKFLFEMGDTTSAKSRFLFTSRNQCPIDYLGEVYKVRFLNSSSAKQLFLSFAFPNHKIPPIEFERLMEAVVQKSEGLPLTLEVLGKYLRTKGNCEDWEQTLHALGKAQDVTDLNERLWAKLRPSYDGLEEKLQQIFLDATTFFSVGTWTLFEAKAAWRVAYDTDSENLLWGKLVEMSLVYDVKDNESIEMHEQLRSLGRKIASEPPNNGKYREWHGERGLKLLQNTEESHEHETFSLRLGRTLSKDMQVHIERAALLSLRKLRYLEVNVSIFVGGDYDFLPVQTELILLHCSTPEFAEVLFHPALQAHLVVLKLAWEKKCLPTYLGSFSALRFFTLFSATHLESIPEEFGSLSQLEVLQLDLCENLQTLPASIGQLKALKYLELSGCDTLRALPESFGQLSALACLEISCCWKLEYLSESFGRLSALTSLKFENCPALRTLPQSFGGLSTLITLEFYACDELLALPESFGRLSALSSLEFEECLALRILPQSFGDLSTLTTLKFTRCGELLALPESFGRLSALKDLTFYECTRLCSLPQSFGDLSLTSLEFEGCEELLALPKSFEQLSAMSDLKFYIRPRFQRLPESFRDLSILQRYSRRYIPGVGMLSKYPHPDGYIVRTGDNWKLHFATGPIASDKNSSGVYSLYATPIQLVSRYKEISPQ